MVTTGPHSALCVIMFDLSFFKIVRKLMRWTEAPGQHFGNDHEKHMARRTKLPFFKECTTATTMTPELISLRMYVWSTYPAYFDVDVRVGKALLDYHQVY